MSTRTDQSPYYEDGGLRLFHGDNREVLKTFADDTFDSIVTDPPYELGFMGKGWDSSGIAYDVDVWREAFRVLKPGGHLLAFGGSRTWHRLAAAIEDSGFGIRDSIAWLYGSGFPKSLDVAKAIDKVRDDVDDVRVVCRWLRDRIDESDHTVKSLAEYFGFHPRMVEHWAARDTDSQPSLPTLAQWDMLRGALGFDDSIDTEVYRLNVRKGEPGEAWTEREVLGEQTGQAPGFMGKRFKGRDTLVRGEGSDASKEWEGWGTSLKPAFEQIVVARKPLAGTVAKTILEHGTGTLNIDATRVDYANEADRAETTNKNQHAKFGTIPGGNAVYGDFSMVESKDYDSSKGRWPTNVVLDESQREALGRHGRLFPTFRYEAKAPGAERPVVDGVGHATVKPLELMRWMVRLVTQPGGHVLDLFAGSGTTGEAALIEGMTCDLIELEADHLPLILARVRKPLQPSMFGDWEEAIA